MEADTVYRHVEGDVPLCVRRKDEENESKSKENENSSTSRKKCDGGSKKMTKNVEGERRDTSSSSTKANKNSETWRVSNGEV